MERCKPVQSFGWRKNPINFYETKLSRCKDALYNKAEKHWNKHGKLWGNSFSKALEVLIKWSKAWKISLFLIKISGLCENPQRGAVVNIIKLSNCQNLRACLSTSASKCTRGPGWRKNEHTIHRQFYIQRHLLKRNIKENIKLLQI